MDLVVLLPLLFAGYGVLLSCIAAPVPAPDITDCHPPSSLPDDEPIFNCCAPPSHHPPLLFQPNHHASPLRVRRPTYASEAPQYAAKLNRAYALMKALPPSDPRSFVQQANIHCAYCNAAYRHRHTSIPFQVHESWLFFPFHRWYLYFHERILATLLQDESFALPFWNYDNEIDSTIPSMFLQHSFLKDNYRDARHLPPAVAQLDSINPCNCSGKDQLALNARIMHHVMVTGGTTASLFMGMPYRYGDQPWPGPGTAEWYPHNKIHMFVGNRTEVGYKDMGSFYAAARDPLFYAHHTNLDRFWEVWKRMEGHQEFDEPDFLDSEFVFYNEKAELVKVRVRDSISTENLGYTYEEVENSWLNARPKPLSRPSRLPDHAINVSLCKMRDDELLDQPCMMRLDIRRQNENILSETADLMQQILVIEGIRVHRSQAERIASAGFHVFLNLPFADSSTTIDSAEYAGSYEFTPYMMRNASNPTTLRLGIGPIVEELHLHTQSQLPITIVPNGVLKSISLSGISIQYESVQGISSSAST